MSDLLNSASLVMIPSGYKEDILYSEIPTDGSGDMAFTRASNGTRINSAGLVEVCPWNLLQQSETFDNGYWSKGQVTVSANATTAPNGTTTADKIISSAVSDEHVIYYFESNILSQVVTMSAYVKKADYRYAILRSVKNGSYEISVFDLDNGIVTSQDLGTSNIESVGNGWYRISTTFTAPAGTYGVQYAFSATQTFSYLGDGTSGNFLWGAQLNIGSTAKPYFPTTDRLNVPRLTYQNGGGGCPSLLLEKQSTNVALWSEDFTNASWLTSNVTVTANQTTSPDGTQNSDSLIPNTTNTTIHRIFESAINSIATASYSIFVKPDGYYRVALRECETTGSSIGFDLLNETIITTYSTGGCTASGGKIENMGNGWYRISGIFSFASATNQRLGLYVVSSSWTSGDPENVSWAGNGTSGVYLYGAQVEASSYPTSYIPTTSSSATRVADACFKTGISNLIGQTEGVLFVDFVVNGRTNNANILNSEKNTTCAFFMALQTTGEFDAGLYVSGSLVGRILAGSISVGQRAKVAYAYKSGSFVLYINGIQAGILSSTFTLPTTLDDIFLNDDTFFNYKEAVKYNQVAIFKTRLTNAELASLTTI